MKFLIKVLLFLILLNFGNKLNAQIVKNDKTVPFYATIGSGNIWAFNKDTPWEITYGLDVSIPVKIKNNFYDIQAGIELYDKKQAAFDRVDFATVFRANIGKRFERKAFLTGIYIGPAFLIIDKSYKRKIELGINANFPIIFKPIEELGLGVVGFSTVSRYEYVLGLKIIIALRNIPKE
ncbi:MAG: hypothetical protein U9R42_07485 [Bacteroidota bacterium]|nr:hypothetical protein [Bacteroidota bacterium]